MQILLTEAQIRQGVEQVARQITQLYSGRPLTIIGVLTGSIMIVADLVRRVDVPLKIGFVRAHSYRGNATLPGELAIHDDLLPDIQGHDVLLVDDIFDTGHTLQALLERLQPLRPNSVRSLVLLRKQGRQQVAIQPDHVIFDIPDAFVVGYGLDFQDAYRHLPYVATLDASDLAESLPP